MLVFVAVYKYILFFLSVSIYRHTHTIFFNSKILCKKLFVWLEKFNSKKSKKFTIRHRSTSWSTSFGVKSFLELNYSLSFNCLNFCYWSGFTVCFLFSSLFNQYPSDQRVLIINNPFHFFYDRFTVAFYLWFVFNLNYFQFFELIINDSLIFCSALVAAHSPNTRAGIKLMIVTVSTFIVAHFNLKSVHSTTTQGNSLGTSRQQKCSRSINVHTLWVIGLFHGIVLLDK